MFVSLGERRRYSVRGSGSAPRWHEDETVCMFVSGPFFVGGVVLGFGLRFCMLRLRNFCVFICTMACFVFEESK